MITKHASSHYYLLDLLKRSQAIIQSPVAVIITDTDGNIEFVNPTFTQLTGYELHDVVGQNPRMLLFAQMFGLPLPGKFLARGEWRCSPTAV